MPWIELPNWYKWLEEKGSVDSANCLRFMTLVPSRSKEIREMRYELDLAKGRWHLENERMKTRKRFTQLMSRQAVEMSSSKSATTFGREQISSNALDKIVKQYAKTDISSSSTVSVYLTWCAEQSENFYTAMNLAISKTS